MPEIYRYGARMEAMNWESAKPKIKKKIEKDMVMLATRLGKNTPPRVGIKTRFMFFMMAGMQKANYNASPIEKEYWQNQGWLGKARPWKNA